MLRISLDIETACNLGCEGKCEHALDEHRNRITVIGVYCSDAEKRAFRTVDSLRVWLSTLPEYSLVGHNLKFDLRTLRAKGLDLAAAWGDDTQLMAAVCLEKVRPDYLEWYEARRKEANAKLPRGYSHRVGSQHSLKVLAPYFLGVEPFWEDPTNHDNDEYVLKDVEYTFRLAEVLEAQLKKEGGYDFYKSKLLPWTKMLLEAETRGVSIDLELLEKLDAEAVATAADARAKLDELWAPAYREYYERQKKVLRESYEEKKQAASHRAKDVGKNAARYDNLYEKAAAKLPNKLNLDSPSQLSWLLRDYLNLDITDFDGEETTGKAVLQKLAGQGREDVKQFLRYRKARKLSTAFFPSYREMHVNGIIHCSFNPTGPRTGRLSASRPNLQQVQRDIKRIFKARPSKKFAIKDESAIEPRLIAYYSSDENLFNIVSQRQDFHGYNAIIFFDLDCDVRDVKKLYPLEREVAKEVGLSILYGAGYPRLQESAQKRGFNWSAAECKLKIERFKLFYRGVYEFRERLNRELMNGAVVKNLLGRPYKIEDPANVHLQGMNTLIQGGASDLVLESGLRANAEYRRLGMDAQVIVFEHDCLIAEADEMSAAEAERILERCMTNYDLRCDLGAIPLDTEGGLASCWEK